MPRNDARTRGSTFAKRKAVAGAAKRSESTRNHYIGILERVKDSCDTDLLDSLFKANGMFTNVVSYCCDLLLHLARQTYTSKGT